MNEAQTLTIVRLVKSMCAAQQIDEFTPDAWHLVLKSVDFDDAKDAVIELAGKLRFIAVSDILGEVKRVRKTRFVDGYQAHLGAAANPDDPKAFLEAVKSDVKAIGDGVPIAEIEAGDRKEAVEAFAATLADRKAIGSRVSL